MLETLYLQLNQCLKVSVHSFFLLCFSQDYLGCIIDCGDLPLKPDEVSTLFCNIEDIYEFNRWVLLCSAFIHILCPTSFFFPCLPLCALQSCLGQKQFGRCCLGGSSICIMWLTQSLAQTVDSCNEKRQGPGCSQEERCFVFEPLQKTHSQPWLLSCTTLNQPWSGLFFFKHKKHIVHHILGSYREQVNFYSLLQKK